MNSVWIRSVREGTYCQSNASVSLTFFLANTSNQSGWRRFQWPIIITFKPTFILFFLASCLLGKRRMGRGKCGIMYSIIIYLFGPSGLLWGLGEKWKNTIWQKKKGASLLWVGRDCDCDVTICFCDDDYDGIDVADAANEILKISFQVAVCNAVLVC